MRTYSAYLTRRVANALASVSQEVRKTLGMCYCGFSYIGIRTAWYYIVDGHIGLGYAGCHHSADHISDEHSRNSRGRLRLTDVNIRPKPGICKKREVFDVGGGNHHAHPGTEVLQRLRG